MLSQPPASVPYLPANPGGRLDTVAGYVSPNLLDVPASFGNSTRLKTVFSMVCFSIDPTYSITVYDSNFPCVARTVFARPSFLADRQRRECRSMPVTVAFGSPIRGWTLRDGNVRDGHPAVLGLYPIPIGEKAGGPETYTAKSIPFCLPREANRKGRISVTRPDGIALYHNSGSVPNPSLTARAAQLVPCEVPPRSL